LVEKDFVMNIKRFPKSKKFMVTAGYASFVATASEIRGGLGMMTNFNAATQKALDALEFQRSGTGVADRAAVGIAGVWEGINVQLNLV
jgi:hypothetical protein